MRNSTVDDLDALGLIAYPEAPKLKFEIEGESVTARAFFNSSIDIPSCTFNIDIPLDFKPHEPTGWRHGKKGSTHEKIYDQIKKNLGAVAEKLKDGTLQKAFTEGAAAVWDNKFKMCCKCQDCKDGIVVRVKLSQSQTGYPVNVYTIGNINSSQDAWNIDQGAGKVAAHEIGHFLGNIDEYKNVTGVKWNNGNGEYSGAKGAAYARPNSPGGNIMNNSNGEALPIHMWYAAQQASASDKRVSQCKAVKINEKCD